MGADKEYFFSFRYISNIQIPGGKIVYCSLTPPKDGATRTSSASEWTIDFDQLEKAISPKTKMIVINTPRKHALGGRGQDFILTRSQHMLIKCTDNPVGKVFSKEELQRIGDLCVKNEIIILSDEVYDRLFYVPFTRMATLSPEIERLTLTVGSAGKNFYATGWRVGTC